MLANTRWSSSHTAVVPLGERFGVPSGQTVATKPRRCSLTTRFISAVRTPMGFSFDTEKRFQPIQLGLELRLEPALPWRAPGDVAEVRFERAVPRGHVGPADDSIAP